MSLKSVSLPGSVWFPLGRKKIGTYKPVVTDDLTLYYEAHPTTIGETAADAALDIPSDWDQCLMDFVAWRVFERVERGTRDKAMYHKLQYQEQVRKARPNAERHTGARVFPRILDY